MSVSRLPVVTGSLLAGLLLIGCTENKDGSAAGDTSAGHDQSDSSVPLDTSDSTDSAGPQPGVHGSVEGTVYLQLYTTDTDGNVELLDWDTEYPDGYPFGSVFVAAYSQDDTGKQTYYDQNVIQHPTVDPAPGGDPFGLNVNVDDVDSVNIYASVDYYADGVIGTGEPTGAYPNQVTVTDNGTVTSIDITVMVPLASSGGGGGGCDNVVDISGTATVSAGYGEGDVAALLYDTNGAGPYTGARITPTANADSSASGDYDIAVCADAGDYELLGVWDSNANGLFDPADQWGSYVTDSSTDGNPISIAEANLPNHDVLVPFGDFVPTVVPFVSLSGTLSAVADWSTYSNVYVAALKYRPTGDTTVATLQTGYDIQTWSTADLAASSSLPFHVEVPANTIVYLWAYADVDGNRTVNEVGEPVANSDSSTGRVVTGSTSVSGFDMVLDVHQ